MRVIEYQRLLLISQLVGFLVSTKAQDFCCLCRNCAPPNNSTNVIDLGDGMTCGELDELMPSWGAFAESPICQELISDYSLDCCSDDKEQQLIDRPFLQDDNAAPTQHEENDTTAFTEAELESSNCCLCTDCGYPSEPHLEIDLSEGMTCGQLASLLPVWNEPANSQACQRINSDYAPLCCGDSVEVLVERTLPPIPQKDEAPNFVVADDSDDGGVCCLCANCEPPSKLASITDFGGGLTCGEIDSMLPNWSLPTNGPTCRYLHSAFAGRCCSTNLLTPEEKRQGRNAGTVYNFDPVFPPIGSNNNNCCLCPDCEAPIAEGTVEFRGGMTCTQLNFLLPNFGASTESPICKSILNDYSPTCCRRDHTSNQNLALVAEENSIPSFDCGNDNEYVIDDSGLPFCCLCSKCGLASQGRSQLPVMPGVDCDLLAVLMMDNENGSTKNSEECTELQNLYSRVCCDDTCEVGSFVGTDAGGYDSVVSTGPTNTVLGSWSCSCITNIDGACRCGPSGSYFVFDSDFVGLSTLPVPAKSDGWLEISCAGSNTLADYARTGTTKACFNVVDSIIQPGTSKVYIRNNCNYEANLQLAYIGCLA